MRIFSQRRHNRPCQHFPSGRCPRCQAVGFVRREYVIKGDIKVVRRHCGRCDYVWDVPEAPAPARGRVPPSGPTRRIHLATKTERNR